MQKINPFLWFKDNAEEAIHFYTEIFNDGKILSMYRSGDVYPGKKGELFVATFTIAGQEFYALNGGQNLPFTPVISFYVDCATAHEVDALWQKLSPGGKAMMPLDKYPFSERYGWIQDKFGISWQLNLTGAQQKITPLLMFTDKYRGKAAEAIDFYSSLFQHSNTLLVAKYGANEGGVEGWIKHAAFVLDGEELKAMDSHIDNSFPFTMAISFFVNCATQEEVDMFWEKLSDGGHKDRCGWLTDKYGVTWQIVPTVLTDLLYHSEPDVAKRVMQAMMKMNKLNIKELQQAAEEV